MSSSAATVEEGLNSARTQQNSGLIPWQPGQSGNPAGRPKGTRDRFCKAFIDDLAAEWARRGPQALTEITVAELVKTGIAVLPKDKLFDPEDGNVIWVINAQPAESVEDWASKHGVKASESHAKAIEHEGNGLGKVELDDG